MLRVSCATAFGFALLLSVALESDAGGNKKKTDNKVDYAGVITEVGRDSNPKDNELGHIIVKDGNNKHRVTITKGTDVVRDGNMVGFKALDVGDRVAVFLKGKGPAADKIVIHKNN